MSESSHRRFREHHEQVNVWLSEELYFRLSAYAQSLDVKVSTAARHLLSEALEKK